MSVAVKVLEIARDVEGFTVCYSLDYTSADGKTRHSVSYENRSAEEFESAAEAIKLRQYHYSRGGPPNGEATFEIKGGEIEFAQCGYGNGEGASLSTTLPAAPWEKAFRVIAHVLRTGQLPEPEGGNA